MTHGPHGSPPEEPGPPEPPEDDERRLTLLGPALPTIAGCVGLVGGWLLRRVVLGLGLVAPLVGWTPAAALFLVAVILGLTARATSRVIRTARDAVEPQHTVNRLVLARACMPVGALVAGGYAGYAISWAGADARLADERIIAAVVASAGGVAVVLTARWLERACRVREDSEDS